MGVYFVNFFKSYDIAVSSAIRDKNVQAITVLDRLGSILDDALFSDYSRAKEFMDTRKLSSERASSVLGITSMSVRWRRSKLSAEAVSLFGADFFDKLLKDNDIEYCTRVIDSAESGWSASTLVPTYISELVRKGTSLEERINLSESHDARQFVDEIKFLAEFSDARVRARFSNVEPWKVLYLLNVLDGSAGTVADRSGLASLIMREAEKAL